MKAISFEAPRQLKRIDIEAPAKPGPGDALVRVHRVGICGTDISGYLGKMPFFSYPRIPGHELGVEVVNVGSGVTAVKPGDRCSVEPYINCQECYTCRRGHTNCCEKLQTLGVHCDGGLRPWFLVPARKLHVSSKLTFEQLALVETLAIGSHAVDRSALRSHESCLIVGAGPIGLATLEFARLTQAKVVMADVNQQRLDFCRMKMGVKHAIMASEGFETGLRDICDGHLADVVIDATGSRASMSRSFGLTAHAGRLVFVGITADPVSFRPSLLHKSEGTLLSSRNALPKDFTRIIELIEDGRIDTQPWITHRAPFDELIDVFPSFTQPETGVVKAIVEIDE